jgi:hypothetical protein
MVEESSGSGRDRDRCLNRFHLNRGLDRRRRRCWSRCRCRCPSHGLNCGGRNRSGRGLHNRRSSNRRAGGERRAGGSGRRRHRRARRRGCGRCHAGTRRGRDDALLEHLHLHHLAAAMAEALADGACVHRLAQLQPPAWAQTEAALGRVLLVLVTHTLVFIQFVLFICPRRKSLASFSHNSSPALDP